MAVIQAHHSRATAQGGELHSYQVCLLTTTKWVPPSPHHSSSRVHWTASYSMQPPQLTVSHCSQWTTLLCAAKGKVAAEVGEDDFRSSLCFTEVLARDAFSFYIATSK